MTPSVSESSSVGSAQSSGETRKSATSSRTKVHEMAPASAVVGAVTEAYSSRNAHDPPKSGSGSSNPPLSTIGNVYFFGYSHFEDFNGVDLLSFVKEHNTTLTFPQKLMLMLTHVDRESASSGKPSEKSCVSWTPDGNAFVIRDRKVFVDTLLPLFFRQAKFPSFTRKLYRWGFRQICIPQSRDQKDRDLFFGHEFFKRDDKSQMANMRSVTAAGTRRAIASLAANKKKRVEAAAAASALDKDDQKPGADATSSGVPEKRLASMDPAPVTSSAPTGLTAKSRASPTSDVTKKSGTSSMTQSGALGANRADAMATRSGIAEAPVPGNLPARGGLPPVSSAILPPGNSSGNPFSAERFLQSLAAQNGPLAQQAASQVSAACAGAASPFAPFANQSFPTLNFPGLFNQALANPAGAFLLSQLSQNFSQNQMRADLAATALLMQMPQQSLQLRNLSNALARTQSAGTNGAQNTHASAPANDPMKTAVDMLLKMNTNRSPSR